MKRTLIIISIVLLGVALGAFALYYQTDTTVSVRDVSGTPLVEISGPLDRAGARKAIHALQRAEQSRPTAILISFDSPGGELAGTLDLAEAINRSSVPTIGWVKNGVAGTVFLIAAVDQIYFAPGGVCGAANLTASGDDSEEDRTSRKILSYMESKLTALSETNGHDAEIFRAFINPTAELVRDSKVWKSKGQALSLTASEALEIGLSIGTASSSEAIIADQATRSVPAPASQSN